MSAAPRWLDEIIGEFGRGAGIQSLSLGERGVAALSGDDGMDFILEYVYPNLILRMTAEVEPSAETAKKVLLFAEPMRQGRFPLRCGFMPRADKAFFAISLSHDLITLPILSEAFRDLRRTAERFTGGAL